MDYSRPALTRQSSLQQLVKNQQQVGTGCICCLLPLAIAAIVIASEYDPSISSCTSDHHMIDLKIFLYIAGGIQLGFSTIYICISCCHSYASISIEQSVALFRSINASNCLFIIFYLIWAGIGCFMYHEQMNINCRSESISIMILSWSIIQFALFGLSFGCILLAVCCVGAVFGMATLVNSIVRRGSRSNRNADNMVGSRADLDNIEQYIEQHNESEANALVDKQAFDEQDFENEISESEDENDHEMAP